jgi:acid phosphatase
MVRSVFVFISALVFASCATPPAAHSPERDLGILWVKHAAEYGAITRQVYQSAERALPGFIDDKSWSAMPEQQHAEELPPAVILDVDETTVSNVEFQISFERPFADNKLIEFYQAQDAIPVPGVVEFVAAARQAGVSVFFLTNRPCVEIANNPDPCPQKTAVLHEIETAGMETDLEHVMLSEEQGWDRAKIARRLHVAETHRVIMLIGDDLGDFVPCVRTKLYGPCAEAATKASRARMVKENSEYWGQGWYILPGPMHGSWTSFP